MSLHDDLLEQAIHLLEREQGKPKQASLRRAVSTAYYALFHLLIDGSVRGMTPKPALRLLMARAFNHNEMLKASRSFAGGTLPQKFADVGAATAVPPELRQVAQAFFNLQRARHDADYNLAKKLSRSDAREFVDQAAQAFQDWQAIREDEQAELYRASLLLWDRWDKIT